jgi:hypothetical protein
MSPTGVMTESQDFFGGQYLEFHTYNSHGNCFYVYLMSISTLLYLKKTCSDYLDSKTDIRAMRVTYAIFLVFGFLQTVYTQYLHGFEESLNN